MDHDRPGDRAAERAATAERLVMLNALVAAADNRAAVMDVIGAAGSTEDAAGGLRALLGVDEYGAQVLLDAQLRHFTTRGRERLLLMRDELADEVDRLDQRD
ncbi:hypothetical protein GCM10027596_35960 [Nocardioides korecus]